MTNNWWHKDRTGDKEHVVNKGKSDALDTKASSPAPILSEPADIEPAKPDEGGIASESGAGPQEEGK